MSTAKAKSVIQVLETDEFEIVNAFRLQNFNRAWIDNPNTRPECTILFDDDADKDVKVLFIGPEEDCEHYLNEIHRAAAEASANAPISIQAFNQTVSKVNELTAQVKSLKNELQQLKNAIGKSSSNNSEIILVGQHNIPLPKAQLFSSTLIGFNVSGFIHLCRSVLGQEFVDFVSWKELGPTLQSKIRDLLAAFIHNYYSDDPNISNKDKEAKRVEIHESLVSSLNSKKYREKQRQKGLGYKSTKRPKVQLSDTTFVTLDSEQSSSSSAFHPYTVDQSNNHHYQDHPADGDLLKLI